MTIGLCIVLAGCSSIGEAAPELETEPAPEISKAAKNIKTVAGQYHLTEPLEIAGPIEAPASSMTPWIICLRSAAEARFTVALFYKADTFVSPRIATMGDHCDGQTYRPLPN